jgi:hypothetical protein
MARFFWFLSLQRFNIIVNSIFPPHFSSVCWYRGKNSVCRSLPVHLHNIIRPVYFTSSNKVYNIHVLRPNFSLIVVFDITIPHHLTPHLTPLTSSHIGAPLPPLMSPHLTFPQSYTHT